MRKLVVAAVWLLALSATEAGADTVDMEDLYRRTLSAAQSLFRPGRPDREIIPAPQDLDREMALIPPRDGSRMPVITPRR
jgi:hypothetical protein